jgi:hypothetical protein
MVESDVPYVTLCLRTGSRSSLQADPTSAAKVLRAAGRGQAAALLAPASNAVAGSACGCEGDVDIEAMSSNPDSGDLSTQNIVTTLSSSGGDSGSGIMASSGEAGSSSCEYQAWLLPLQAGQNVFNLTLPGEEQLQQQQHQMLAKLPLVRPLQQPTR